MIAPHSIFSLAQAASTTGVQVDYIFYLLLAFSGTVVLVIMFLVLFFVAKYHRGTSANRKSEAPISSRLEVFIVTVFTVIGLTLFVLAAKVYADIARPPKDAMTIWVVGKQWMWKASYPDHREEINELHVPVGQPVKLVMTSMDVIHSFFIPDFRVKQDVLPSRYTTLWFTATKPGKYRLRCSQYCGNDHAGMVGWVTVLSQADYQQWLAAAPEGAAAIAGTPGTNGALMATKLRTTFNQLGCIACHTPTSSVRAPRLDGIFNQTVRLQNGQNTTADEEYLRESILFPNAKISAGYVQPSLMPAYKGQITDQQLHELVDFIKSIRDGWPADATQPTEPSGNQPLQSEPKR